MLKLAVTGGIGSGKSFVSRMLSVMGCPVYDTDSRTKKLYDVSVSLRSALQDILGEEIFCYGVIDRKAMAEKLFADATLLSCVEALVYPELLDNLEEWIDECVVRGVRVAVVESALILEKTIFRGSVDRVLTVSAPEELRIKRAMTRDNSGREQVLERMKRQHTDEWREERADYVLHNDGRPVLPQLIEIIEDILNIKEIPKFCRPAGTQFPSGVQGG